MTFKLPEPVGYQWIDSSIFRKQIPKQATPQHWEKVYTHEQIIKVLRDWGEEMAKECEKISEVREKGGAERTISELIDERDYRERVIDALCDALLGPNRREWSSTYSFDDAVLEVEETIEQFNGSSARNLRMKLNTNMPSERTPGYTAKETGMNADEIILIQAKRIVALEQRVAELDRANLDARSHMYCIGGPLNDNKWGYTRDQLTPFFRMAECLDV